MTNTEVQINEIYRSISDAMAKSRPDVQDETNVAEVAKFELWFQIRAALTQQLKGLDPDFPASDFRRNCRNWLPWE